MGDVAVATLAPYVLYVVLLQTTPHPLTGQRSRMDSGIVYQVQVPGRWQEIPQQRRRAYTGAPEHKQECTAAAAAATVLVRGSL